ncbi:MAG TPA: hypothetical protein VH207_00155 [Chthoniobacterales bacterium]|nr:hypothetical protein [Chthoniobacterales bacterium]
MKPLSILFLLGVLSGCAENTAPAEEVRDHFERGLSGQGRIVPLEQPGEPVPPPPEATPGPQ